MSNFKTIQAKLQQFIKKFYTNELLKGIILFFAIGVLYFMITLLIEYALWLNPTARTILFWLFIAVEVALFTKFILFPLSQLFNLRKGIDFETASKLIGSHFPEVDDKLLNVLQLNKGDQQSDLLLASIEQKSAELKPIPFQTAINFQSSLKYLKYAAIPVAILLLAFVTGKINWFSDGYERIVNYQTAYEPPAPFQFFVVNETLQAIENKDYTLIVKTVGDVIPDQVQIDYNGQTYFLQQNIPGEFQYTFNQPKEDISFVLNANDVSSKNYDLKVINVPTLVGFDMVLDYPNHTQKRDETLKSTGSATIPEGTKVTWKVNTKSTTDVKILSKDTINFANDNAGNFSATKRLYSNYSYSINTSNQDLKNYESLAFSISVTKDTYPELSIKVETDSLDQQSLYFYGQANDDYGLKKLQLVYYPSDNEKNKEVVDIPISKSNFSEFVSAFPNELNIKEGIAYDLYFQVFDNDALHNFKSVKSTIFSYRKRTKDEEENKQLNEQSETIKNISKTFEKLEEQDKKLQELSKTQKEKEALNFNDKKKFEEFLKRQKQQEEMMKNFNKKLQDNLEEFQKEKDEDGEKDEFKEDLKERLKENEEQLKKDEKLLEELEKMTEKINKEEFSQKLEELAKQNKNKKRSMQQLLELTKRFYVTKKQEKIQKELEDLSKKQEELSEKNKEENTKEAQQKLNKQFKDLQKQIDDLMSENRKLRKPEDIQRDKLIEESIKEDQKEAKENLEKSEELEKENSEKQKDSEEQKAQQQKAKKKQKKAAKKMKQLSEMMKMSMDAGGAGGDKMEEDVEMLRQILDNLVLFSFDQENLMDKFNTIDVNHNQYGKFIIKQSNLKEHFEHVDDSLFALSLRNPKISEKINSQITDVYFNIEKSLSQLTENRIYQGVSSQQYTITAANTLADMLSNILDSSQEQMNMKPGQGQGEMQLPDIIMSQEELNKKMEEAMKKLEKGDKPEEKGEDGEKREKGGKKPGEGEKPGEEGKEGKQGEQGEQGQSGESGQSGEQSGGDKGESKQGKSGEGKDGKGENGENKNGEGEGKEGKGKDGKNGEKGKNGKEGKGNEDSEGKNEGYGEGGSEEMNGELYKIYQQQQKIKQALENRIQKDGTEGSAGELIKQMEDVELDLINKGFTNQTLQKMMDVQHQLLKMENATFTQGEEEKRESKTNRKEYNTPTQNQIDTAKQYFNTIEILNRQALPLRSQFKKKLQDYFKNAND